MSSRKCRQRYLLKITLGAVRLFCEEGKIRAQIAERLGIPDRCRLKKWLRQYRQECAAFTKKRRGSGRRPIKESKDAYTARLEMENDLLETAGRVAQGYVRAAQLRLIEAHRGNNR